MNVGFIGLGAMGLPMARRVLSAGHTMYTTFHRRREPAEELRAVGATILATPAEVAAAADVVITILPADAELREVVFGATGILGGVASGKTLIEMTSGTALAVQEIAAAIERKGGAILDAPVSGGTPAAEQGTLTIMVGGDEALLERFRPLLQAMGTRILHVGKVGQGKIVKIVNQMMAAIHLLTIGEAFALGIKNGADPDVLYEVIKNSSGYSKMMDLRLPGFLLEGSFEPGFKLDLMKKDVNLALESAKASSAPLLLTSAAAQVFAAASAAGKGSNDFSAAAQFLASLAGIDISKAKAKLA
ncbi:MAG TPA: NAD(P)-dependent oxidoreductase [Terriglobales bacterium]|nr:NAD(P)-dependent oxidoreductase [Terriglobales bacterium]